MKHSLKLYSKTSGYLLLFIFNAAFLFSPKAASADDNYDYANEKTRLIKVLKSKNPDNAYLQNIDRFYAITCDSLIKKKLKIDNRPIKDILARLFEVSFNNIYTGNVTTISIPSLNYNFLLTLKTYNHESIHNLYEHINFSQSKMLASVFDGLLLGDSIRNITGLREMLHEPYFISSNIQLPQYETYRNTLLYHMANGAPEILNRKLAEQDTLYTALVNKSDKISVKAVAQVKLDSYYDRTLPFGLAILQNRMNEEEIRKLTLVPQDYYHAFVEEVIRLHNSKDPEINSFLKQPIVNLNKKFGNYYFIKEINDLHELPDKTRYQVLNTLQAIDLYFLMLAGSYDLVMEGSSALYTSSFFYVYNKFLKETEKDGINKFFDDIGYYQFDQFISNISDYGLVDDLVSKMQEEKIAQIFAKSLESLTDYQHNENEIILKAMTMAEILYAIRHRDNLKTTLIAQADRIIKQPLTVNNFLYQRMYRGFKDILMDKNTYASDLTYDVLKVKQLQWKNSIVQVCFFYDDDDGVVSFNNSTATYDAKTWDKKDMGNYIVFTSTRGNNMKVYMNKPKTTAGSDTAQHEMLRAIEQEGLVVTSFIHRGHSYHLSKSLEKMTASSQFVFLGSCGGYSQVLKIFQLNPDVNIISTRSVGSLHINDPLLGKINADIVNNKDIQWDDLWKEFDSKFQSKLTKDLFQAYMAPNKYIGIKYMRKVLNY